AVHPQAAGGRAMSRPAAGARPAVVLGRGIAAVAVLAVASVVWAAVPMPGALPGARPALIVAIGCAALSLARLGLVIGAGRAPELDGDFPPLLVGAARWIVTAARRFPWAQGMIVAVVALEALHPARPWHTAVLGLILVGYLLALRLAETGAGRSALRRQVPLLATGAALAALSIGAAVLPAAGPGTSGWMAALAAAAAVVAAALVLPI
ncbi:MAG: hypothetical protein ACYCPF_16205, partial [Streptosporangiaceae bacterium]